jgi:hypothetical protein
MKRDDRKHVGKPTLAELQTKLDGVRREVRNLTVMGMDPKQPPDQAELIKDLEQSARVDMRLRSHTPRASAFTVRNAVTATRSPQSDKMDGPTMRFRRCFCLCGCARCTFRAATDIDHRAVRPCTLNQRRRINIPVKENALRSCDPPTSAGPM